MEVSGRGGEEKADQWAFFLDVVWRGARGGGRLSSLFLTGTWSIGGAGEIVISEADVKVLWDRPVPYYDERRLREGFEWREFGERQPVVTGACAQTSPIRASTDGSWTRAASSSSHQTCCSV